MHVCTFKHTHYQKLRGLFVVQMYLVSFEYFILTFDGDLLALKVVQVAQQHLLPVTPVADKAQVRQGAFR